MSKYEPKLNAYEQQLQQQQEELQHQYGLVGALDKSSKVYQQECARLQKALYDQLLKWQTLQNQMVFQKSRHEQEIAKLTSDAAQEKRRLISEFDQRIDQLTSDHIRDVEWPTNEHQAILEQTEAAHGKAVSAYEARLEALNQELEQYRNRIQELEQAYGMLMSYAQGFYPCGWATGLIPYWREYYGLHYAEIPALKERLKVEMDRQSADVIDLLCERNFYLLPSIADKDKFLYRYDDLYTGWEREGMAHPCDKEAFRARFVIPAELYLETTVVEFQNGLTLLPKTVQSRLCGAHIIDGGACWGDSMLAFSEHRPAQIHCFEPNPDNFKRLEQIVLDNELQSLVTCNQNGLSDSDRSTPLYSSNQIITCSNIIGYSVTEDRVEERGSIELTSIDSYTARHGISVGMIKLDVEGAEFDTIRGALETIKRDRPILLISIYHMPKDFFEIKPLLEGLNLGYRFMVRKTTYRDLIAEVMLLGYIEGE